MSDRHTRVVVTVAVTSAMLAASTVALAWCFERFTATEGYRYCFPLIVYGTVWLMVTVFAAGIGWGLSELVTEWVRGPKTPRPSTPPSQPSPRDTPRPAPAPIQPHRPKPGTPPPTRRAETTLVDLDPVCDLTIEMRPVTPKPRVGWIHVSQQDLDDWRPPVSNNSKESSG